MKKTMGLVGRRGLVRLNFPKKMQGGFTLIELLVVISIIGLLSSVVLSSLNSARAKAEDSKTVQSLNQLKRALELYYDQNGRYPTNPVANATYGQNCWDCSANFFAPADAGRLAVLSAYLNTRPSSISSGGFGTGYFYKVSTSGKDYKLALLSGFKDNNNIPLIMQDSLFYWTLNPHASIYSSDVSKTWAMTTNVSAL